jgi:plastocyanin
MGYRIIFFVIVLIFIVAILGCGGEDKTSSEMQETFQKEEILQTKQLGTATISGLVHFNGTAPPRKRIKQDKECQILHAEPVYSQAVIVNDNNTLKYVFIYVKEGLSDLKFDPPAESVLLDQRGCMFEPHVFGLQIGQNIKILNSDPLLHNIHALPKKNRPFNFGMPKQGDTRERSFKKSEIMVRIKCDVHPWMGAFAGVLSHPYFSVTDDNGTYNLENLPAGEYVIEAWHEKYGTTTQNVKIGDNETKNIDFSYGEKTPAS